MIALARALREKFKGASLVLTVHDELVVEASIEDAQKVGAVMKTEMEGVMTLDVPIIVDVATGVNWQEMTELDMVK